MNDKVVKRLKQTLDNDYCQKIGLRSSIAHIWYYDTNIVSSININDLCCLPAVIEHNDNMTILKYYTLDIDKTNTLIKALVDYICEHTFNFNDHHIRTTTLLALSDILKQVDEEILTEDDVNREFITKIVESNVKWLNSLNFKHMLQTTMEEKDREHMIRLIDNM